MSTTLPAMLEEEFSGLLQSGAETLSVPLRWGVAESVGTANLSNGNRTVYVTGRGTVRASAGAAGVKRYVEFLVEAQSGDGAAIGVSNAGATFAGQYGSLVAAYYMSGVVGNPAAATGWGYGSGANVGDIVGLLIDTSTGVSKAWITINGVLQAGGDPVTGAGSITQITNVATTGSLYPTAVCYPNGSSGIFTMRAQASEWTYAPPAGFTEFPDETISTSSTYIDDLFAPFTYAGNGISQKIQNGVNLLDKGGMVLTMRRDAGGIAPVVVDTIRGANSYFYTDSGNGSAASGTYDSLFGGFDHDGYGVRSASNVNIGGGTAVGFSFRAAAKFFVMKQVSHVNGANTVVDLSVLGTVGMTWTKSMSSGVNWWVHHRGLATGQYLVLNGIAGVASGDTWSLGTTTLTIPAATATQTFMVYAWAHDPSTAGVVQCGTLTLDGSGSFSPVNLGWEPQYLLIKNLSGGNWVLMDHIRGFDIAEYKQLFPNSSFAESSSGAPYFYPTPTGISSGSALSSYPSSQWAYMAIRRPNKPAALLGASKVFCPMVREGTGSDRNIITPGFPADTLINTARPISSDNRWVVSRLRGGRVVSTNVTGPETVNTPVPTFDVMQGYGLRGAAYNGSTSYIDYALKRAPGFFDEVCYTGSGVETIRNHSLGSIPGMIWVKGRNSNLDPLVYHSSRGPGYFTYLNLNAAEVANSGSAWGTIAPTSTTFRVGTSAWVNGSGGTYTALLFGDTPGLCKANVFTLGLTSVTVNLGFTPRLFLCKRTDAVGDWYVWDTARGIISANDPYLLLNGTAAETTTTDHVDPTTNGIVVNPTLPAGSYIYWACA